MRLLLLVFIALILFSCKKTEQLELAPTKIKPPQIAQQLPKCIELTEDVRKSATRRRRWQIYLDSLLNVNTGNLPKTCLYLDFDGAKVENTLWDGKGPRYFAPANITEEQKKAIVKNIEDDYSPFRVSITRDSLVYANADPMNRQRLIVTDESQWYNAGGIAYIGSSTWGDNTPCFVFCSLLGNVTKYIQEAASHELGHTMGLRHQAVYNASCEMITEYNQGYGTGKTSFAPIMGTGYYATIVNWFKGHSSDSCSAIQDDYAILSKRLGVWADDLDDIISVVQYTNLPHTGILNKAGDRDAVKIRITAPKIIKVSSVNADIQLEVYNADLQLISTVNDPDTPDASITLNAGTYYLSIKAASNTFMSSQFMTGEYHVTANNPPKK